MAEDAPKPDEVVLSAHVPPPDPEPEPEKPVLVSEEPAPAAVVEEEKEKPGVKEEEELLVVKTEEKVTETAPFVEETNVVGELPEPQKKALEELKLLVQEALNKHEFTLPPKEEEKKEEGEKTEEAAKETAPEAVPPKVDEPPKLEEVVVAVVEAESEAPPPPPVLEEEKKEEEAPAAVVVEEVVEKVAEVDDDGAKTVEAIKETIVEVAVPPLAESEAPAELPKETTEEVVDEPPKETEAQPEAPLLPPEEVFIWGIPLLGDERSDVILLKFLRARDFKVKEAFTMLKNTVIWRKEFGIDSLLEEDLGTELDKVVFAHGVDKEGHPVCYNVFGEFQNKELYQNTLADEEKRRKFLKWRIQFLEKSIQKLDFSPTGINKIVQVNDLKNSPLITKKELRLATRQAVQLLQDNYPEFVARQVFINVPWWYFAFYSLLSPFMTQRTKSKFVFSRSTEALFKYVAPEHVPAQYGGLSRDGEQEFTIADPTTEVTIKPLSTHTVEFPVTENSILVWEVRVVGWEVSYGAEFVADAEGSYTVIIQKSRKIAAADETVITNTFKIGEPGKVVFKVDNQSYKKKKLFYRSKTKPYTD
ncbi:hypothetical protein MLD38_013090 [Melastoma candidum]|uniref:Uncharacterized protein n=1 Tax=Melastoma candidum TaxID=119954 RepID=A0ACB9RBJ2_9MYRT|nr:hypothetical protein MLD38_013090 [Melastoma candidum]